MDDRRQRPLLIGWKEYVDFPDWGVRHVKIKVDTGARTSALGAIHHELREVPGRGIVAKLHMSLRRRKPESITIVEVPVLKMVVVSNSGGMKEERPLIEARIRFGPITKTVQLTVTNRAGMLFPLILGRRALNGDFVVDVSEKYLLRGR